LLLLLLLVLLLLLSFIIVIDNVDVDSVQFVNSTNLLYYML